MSSLGTSLSLTEFLWDLLYRLTTFLACDSLSERTQRTSSVPSSVPSAVMFFVLASLLLPQAASWPMQSTEAIRPRHKRFVIDVGVRGFTILASNARNSSSSGFLYVHSGLNRRFFSRLKAQSVQTFSQYIISVKTCQFGVSIFRCEINELTIFTSSKLV